MTDQEINIKVAELCGYRKATDRDRTRGKYEWVAVNPIGFEIGWSDNCEYHHCIPNYTADLNSCHSAEAAKEMHFDQRWIEAIVEVALRESGRSIERTDGWDWVALVARLSARQRCEAFLRVHGQWEEAE